MEDSRLKAKGLRPLLLVYPVSELPLYPVDLTGPLILSFSNRVDVDLLKDKRLLVQNLKYTVYYTPNVRIVSMLTTD